MQDKRTSAKLWIVMVTIYMFTFIVKKVDYFLFETTIIYLLMLENNRAGNNAAVFPVYF